MRPAPLALLAAVLLGGCAGGEKEAPPEPATGAPKQVAEVIARLERAAAAKDYRTVCALLSSAARERAGGKRCEASLGEQGAGVREPTIRVLSIGIEADRATARVRTEAVGQAPVDETIELVREDGKYLIAALGG
ncbi:MAG: hypothetical protein WKF29_09875 [Thermoleophilaceae bacterium]